MANSVRLTEDQAADIERQLLSGATCQSVADDYNRSEGWVSLAAQQIGLTYNKKTAKWSKTGRPVVKQGRPETAQVYPVRMTEQQQDVVKTMLLDGKTTRDVAACLDRSNTWAARAAWQVGLKYDFTAGAWIDTGETTVSNELTAAEYADLVTPDRERSNGKVETVVVEQMTVTDMTEATMAEMDADIAEALNLLGLAEQQRKDDIKAIANLTRQLADAETTVKRFGDKLDQVRMERQDLETRVLKLEGENKRLMDRLKGEISRGFLRQGMDSLRKVL
jgi:hypothetical protein